MDLNDAASRIIQMDLIDAAYYGDLDEVRRLITGGLVDNKGYISPTVARETALSIATSRGYLAMVEYLVELGAKIEYVDCNGDTALSIAAQNGQQAVVKYLVEKGAAIDHRNHDGDTALALATSKGHLAVAEYLERVQGQRGVGARTKSAARR